MPVAKANKLFNELSDRIEKDGKTERVISFKNFALGCVMNNIFTLETQLSFLKVKNKSECNAKLQALLPKIDSQFKIIAERFESIGKGDSFYKKWIDHIKSDITQDNISNPNVVLIQLKLIETESIHAFTEYCSFLLV